MIHSIVFSCLKIKIDQQTGRRRRRVYSLLDSMYNPLSIYTVIPWAILLDVSEAVLMMILDAIIGESFNDTVKGSLCLVLFLLNFIYIIYTVVIHFAIIANIRTAKIKATEKRYPITFTDLFNLLISASL